MTTKQVMSQGPTMRKVPRGAFDFSRTEWYDSETWRRWDELRERIERRRTDLMAARRRYRRRIGLPR